MVSMSSTGARSHDAKAKVLVLSGCHEEPKVMKVGFVGLGNMGSGMAANLLKAGHALSGVKQTPFMQPNMSANDRR